MKIDWILEDECTSRGGVDSDRVYRSIKIEIERAAEQISVSRLSSCK